MPAFEHIEDVTEWLEPLDYAAFWKAVGPYQLVLQDRAFCDAQIARREVEQDLVLDVLKGMARTELTQIFRLKHRIWHPPGAPH
ncbi:hypothetical protein [Jiella marina]|uniref:hypothetical protein n=1 Tax=Jiella sp. LLJ827 TaxID=2917712 RepID=UPI0021018DD4|nr:hypothetical protein [Jiella sp. LLJ827]MCQ0989590.1 hypothetical protein [Jiella sp. LLJ827]